ncbi:hypothetical protein ACE1CI_25415 [Aerosakkonemataceae cyanobacterium BLCC-F50]|uniref:Uncharacterized protein n=1 Tax=Floridaenema flaviceps BLCC-F50 TaxID=3153642 RepID=A0ABV4XWZ5_9CYAN
MDKPNTKKGKLTATWVLVDGKLTCKWEICHLEDKGSLIINFPSHPEAA